MGTKIFVSDGLLCKELEIDTLPKGVQRGHLAAADIFVKCAIGDNALKTRARIFDFLCTF